VLASASTARLRVLRDAGLDPEVVASGVEEELRGLDAEGAVAVLAERKAAGVAGRRSAGLVLGCDSLLDLDGAAVGKPATAEEAIGVWRRLGGRQCTLWTGQCLIDAASGRRVVEVARALVRFAAPTDDEIAAYVATGEPEAMAGAFSIDGLGAPFVEGVDGDPNAVRGLSVVLLRRMLAELGVAITDLWRRPSPLVRDVAAGDRGWLADLVAREWGLPIVTPSGVYDPAADLAGLVAEVDGDRAGALSYREGADGMEVVTLNSLREGRGVGSALLAEARRRARAQGRRLWLVTTNDNLRAIGFYQRRGMDLVALHCDFVEVVRRAKPGLDPVGEGGIHFRHALELEYPGPPAG
jgi:nucleoside triphosphate pyrophosphatase